MRVRLLRYVPWWLASVVWGLAMLVFGAVWLSFLVSAISNVSKLLSNAGSGNGLGAVISAYLALLVGIWWMREARHWRQLTPSALRPEPEAMGRTGRA